MLYPMVHAQERDWVLSEFKVGRSPVMIATDVAARGLGAILLVWPLPARCCANAGCSDCIKNGNACCAALIALALQSQALGVGELRPKFFPWSI
jgi:hypothetical protein